jgi:hypothetical protein
VGVCWSGYMRQSPNVISSVIRVCFWLGNWKWWLKVGGINGGLLVSPANERFELGLSCSWPSLISACVWGVMNQINFLLLKGLICVPSICFSIAVFGPVFVESVLFGWLKLCKLNLKQNNRTVRSGLYISTRS